MDLNQAVSKMSVPAIVDLKFQGRKIACITAYDYPTARIADETGIDLILVGDTLAEVVLGYDSTLPVTVEEMLHHLRAVRRAVKTALVVVDLPYGSFHQGEAETVAAAIRFVKEGGAEAVKLEGGQKRASLIRRLVDEEIPVMGHIGLTPQSLHRLGGYGVQGKTVESAHQLLADAQAVEDAGAFAIVLEAIPRQLARLVTQRLRIPSIGIGAGPDCDGQILVLHDLAGFSFRPPSKFVRPYANLGTILRDAFARYRSDVADGRYPSDVESYHWNAATEHEFEKESERKASALAPLYVRRNSMKSRRP